MFDQLLIGLLFATSISVLSYAVRFLTFGGAVAQFLLGTILLGLGGWGWTVPMVVFFILSSLISRFGKRRRASAESHFEKSSRRDAFQVLANGGVAGALTLLWLFSGNETLYYAHLGAVAAATADTWGTEFGTLSRYPPFLITTFKRVESGRSGAISSLGLLAGVVGTIIIWGSSLPWAQSYEVAFLATTLGGVLGSLVDSMLGATIQAQFKCAVCGKVTERDLHCGSKTTLFSGFQQIRNDHVNLACTLCGATVAYLLSSL